MIFPKYVTTTIIFVGIKFGYRKRSQTSPYREPAINRKQQQLAYTSGRKRPAMIENYTKQSANTELDIET